MTCSGDVGTGGVQQVFRDLIRALENEERQVVLVYQAALPQLRLTRGRNGWGREAFHCAMPTIVRNSALLGLLVALVYLPVALFHLTRLIRRHKIDAINCHYLAEYFLHLVIAGRLMRVPVVISVHGADVDRYATASPAQRWLLRLVMRGANRIVGCSEAMARQTAEAFPAAATKATYVHNGLDVAQLSATEAAQPVATPFVLCVCRQVVKKGVDTLVRAFALLGRDFPDVSLVVVGDGPALEWNRALARTLGIERRVGFTGDVPHTDVLRYFAACSVLAVPSRAEPFGLVVLEGAYYKKGMVCTRVGGIPEIVADKVSALLVEADDHVAMAAALAALLRDPELAGRLGAHAHQVLMQRFRWEGRVKDYIRVFETAGGPLPRADTTLSAASFHSTPA
jgi:glycosyltransferase involved in cell wall biosynthesis